MPRTPTIRTMVRMTFVSAPAASVRRRQGGIKAGGGRGFRRRRNPSYLETTMEAFATLLDRLVLAPQRNAKLRLMVDYFRATPDPDRGHALAALTGDLRIASVKPAMLRTLVTARVDEVLFAYSYDYVGDLAETISLIWPARAGANRAPDLSEVVERLHAASRSEGPKLVEGWLDSLDATG